MLSVLPNLNCVTIKKSFNSKYTISTQTTLIIYENNSLKLFFYWIRKMMKIQTLKCIQFINWIPVNSPDLASKLI